MRLPTIPDATNLAFMLEANDHLLCKLSDAIRAMFATIPKNADYPGLEAFTEALGEWEQRCECLVTIGEEMQLIGDHLRGIKRG